MPRAVDPEWMTYVEAMPVLGCSHATVAKLVHEGRIRSREQAWRRLPSLWRADVARVATELDAERREVERQRAARRTARPASAPPDDEHVWLTTTEAALVIGMTRHGVMYRVNEGQLPATRVGQRTWLRREHVEQAAAARAFARRRAAAELPP